MLQPDEQRFRTGVHRSAIPHGLLQAEQGEFLHVEIDDRLLSLGGALGSRLHAFPSGARGDGSLPARVDPTAWGTTSPGVARDERHTAGPPGAGTGSLRRVSTLLSFAPILLWAAAVLDAMSEVLSGVSPAPNLFAGLLAGSTLASGLVIAIQSGSRKDPPPRQVGARAQRTQDRDAVGERRS
jgi:hypothetical protein